MPQKEKKELVQLLGRYEVPLIEDDIYGDLYQGEHRPRPAKYYDRKGLVLHCSSFSKTLAPGMRIGWVLPGRYRERIIRIKYMQSIAANHFLQRVIAQYLETNRYERHLKKLRHALSVQMMQTLKAIQHYFPEQVCSTCPQGGMTLWLQLPPKVDSYLLYQAALKQDIHLTPGLVFSTQKDTYRNYLRLSYAEPWNSAKEQAIAWIGQYLKKPH